MKTFCSYNATRWIKTSFINWLDSPDYCWCFWLLLAYIISIFYCTVFWQTEFLPVTRHDWLDVLCCVLTNWDLPSYTWWLTGWWKQLWPKIGRQQMYANNTGIMTVGLHLEWTGLWEHPPPPTPCFSLLRCDMECIFLFVIVKKNTVL